LIAVIRQALGAPVRALRAEPAPGGRTAAAEYPLTLAACALAAALAPLYVIRWHVGSLPTTLLEAALLLAFAAFVFESVRSGRMPAWRSPLTPPAALFLVAGAIAVAAAPSRTAALGIYRAYLVEPVLLALVLATVVRTSRQAWLVIGGLWAGGVVLAVANIEVVLQAAREHRLDVHVPAPSALYLSPNAVALFLVPLLGVAGAAVLHAGSRPVRAVAGAFVVVALPATVLTFSRGGWLALGVVAAGLALSHRRRWLLFACMAALAAAAAAVIPDVAHLAVLLLHEGAGNTSGDRVRLWTLTLHVLSQRPLLGTGLAGFRPTVVPLWTTGDSSWILYPHDLALDLWAETGLLGLLSFVWAFAVVAVVSWAGWRRGAPAWRSVHLGVLLALVAVLVHGAIDNPYFKNDLSVEFWTLAALAWTGWRAASARVG
jgi:putative inorganic carbon (HCO3(-)) transporter